MVLHRDRVFWVVADELDAVTNEAWDIELNVGGIEHLRVFERHVGGTDQDEEVKSANLWRLFNFSSERPRLEVGRPRAMAMDTTTPFSIDYDSVWSIC